MFRLGSRQCGIEHIGWRDYSPWFIALWTTIFIYMALILLNEFSTSVPGWLWYWGGVYFFVGILLSFVSKRLFWIRLYQIFGLINVATFFAVLLAVTLQRNDNFGNSIWIGFMLMFFSIGNISLGYRSARIQLGKVGYGLSGTLDTATGVLDPYKSPPKRQRRLEQDQQTEKIWLRLMPLIAGLSMFLVNIMSDQDVRIFIAVAAMGLLWLGTMGIGRYSYYIVWTRNWERQHKRQIVLQS